MNATLEHEEAEDEESWVEHDLGPACGPMRAPFPPDWTEQDGPYHEQEPIRWRFTLGLPT